MNTYEQDTFIPIYMTLQYEKYMMKFPINPEVLKKEIPSDSTTVEVEGIGVIPKTSDNKHKFIFLASKESSTISHVYCVD